jgi:hypothetical protein
VLILAHIVAGGRILAVHVDGDDILWEWYAKSVALPAASGL